MLTPALMRHAVLWLVLLMTFMGGRVLAPAINGHLMSSRRQVGAGVQPRLEAALIVLLGVTPLLAPWSATASLAAPLTATAGLLVLWRLWRWRPWACRQRPDLLGLLLGYAWLGFGLLLAARVLWLGQPLGGVLHAFTVGRWVPWPAASCCARPSSGPRGGPSEPLAVAAGTALHRGRRAAPGGLSGGRCLAAPAVGFRPGLEPGLAAHRLAAAIGRARVPSRARS